MADRNSLTVERVRALLDYATLTGVFTRRVNRQSFKAGEEAGGLHKRSGYWVIVVDGVWCLRGRLAWFYTHGVWPEPEVDHKDTVKTHDWIDNLRPATNAQNIQNQLAAHRQGRSGYLGVKWSDRHQRWMATIQINGKRKQLGLFEDPHAAHLRYLEAKATIHPFAIPPQSARRIGLPGPPA